MHTWRQIDHNPSTNGLLASLAVCILLLMQGCGGAGAGAQGALPVSNVPIPVTGDLDEQLSSSLKAQGGIGFFTLPDSENLTSIPQDPKNPLTEQKVALGKSLFHDPSLGSVPQDLRYRGTYSCASCHHARKGFQSGVSQGVGEGGVGLLFRAKAEDADVRLIDVQPIRAPSAMNGAYQQNMLWNGQFGATGLNAGTEGAWTVGTPKALNMLGYQGLETQAIAGQGVHRLGEAPKIYQALFDAAFPDWPPDRRYSTEAAGLAIAAFERTVMANQAPFQRWLRGERSALTQAQKRGAILFFGKARCVECHTGPALNSESFHALGMKDLVGFRVDVSQSEHKGRGGFTGVDADLYRFKVPQLYNLQDAGPLGHGSEFASVRDVLRYKNLGVASNVNVPSRYLSPKFMPLALSDAELDDLADFIAQGLRDQNLTRYEPISLPTGVCPVNEDPQTRLELGFSLN